MVFQGFVFFWYLERVAWSLKGIMVRLSKESVRWSQKGIIWCWESVIKLREGVRWSRKGVRWSQRGVRWPWEDVILSREGAIRSQEGFRWCWKMSDVLGKLTLGLQNESDGVVADDLEMVLGSFQMVCQRCQKANTSLFQQTTNQTHTQTD